MPDHNTALAALCQVSFKTLFHPDFDKEVFVRIGSVHSQNLVFSGKSRIKGICAVGNDFLLCPSDFDSLIRVEIGGRFSAAGMISAALKREIIRLRPCIVISAASVIEVFRAEIMRKFVRRNADRHNVSGLIVFAEIADTPAPV